VADLMERAQAARVARDSISIAANISHPDGRSGGQISKICMYFAHRLPLAGVEPFEVAMLTHVVEDSEWPLWGIGHAHHHPASSQLCTAECGLTGNWPQSSKAGAGT